MKSRDVVPDIRYYQVFGQESGIRLVPLSGKKQYLFIYFPELHISTIYNHNVNFKYKIAGGGAQKDI